MAVTPRITLAPLTTRFAWIKDQHRMSTYVKGARGKLQLLAYVLSTPLDEARAGELLYAGPVMLTFMVPGSELMVLDLDRIHPSLREAGYEG